MSKEKYKSKERQKDRTKIICNKIFARLSGRNKGNCLILDAETFQTTKNLIKVGFKYTDIIIPNPYAFTKMNKNKPEGVKLYELTLGELLNQLPVKIRNAWFDYCGEFGGNKDTNPADDIWTYFHKRIPEEYGTFAITIKTSRRGEKEYTGQDVSEADCYIQEVAHESGYVLVKTNHIYYNHGMVFMCYKVFPRYE